MLGIRAAWRDESELSPAESVFGSQPVLPGQFLTAPEAPSPTFLEDFQGVLASRTARPTNHHTPPAAPESLPEDLLLARFVLVRQDGVRPPLAPLYTGPFKVLERSTHFFKLQLGEKQDTVSTHRLKACHTPDDTAAATPPRRGRPARPAAPPHPPDPVPTPAPPRPPSSRRVTFAPVPPQAQPCPVPPDPSSTAGRPTRNVRRPARFL
jgi:hypothetical protein